uniref:SEFIR domain-containing protein n=3 Tax=Parascaris univalens TaxID=6257 RepID=A0A914ZJT0_PARUN
LLLSTTLSTKSCTTAAVITIIDELNVQVSCCTCRAMYLHRLRAMRCGATMQTCGAYRRLTSMRCHQTLLRLLMVHSRRIFNSLINIRIISSIILFSVVFAPYSSASIATAKFRHDCSDQIHKEIACTAHIVNCDEVDAPVDSTFPLPGAAHDIRVEPFARAMPRRSQQKYQLSVDMSWQMPPNNSTSFLDAFFLEINANDVTNNGRSCFLLNVTDSEWTTEIISSSPRFHFSTENIFEFGRIYDVILTSLPRSNSSQQSITKHVTMPRHPELNKTLSDPSFDCSKYSNPYASKWTAGFRRIFVHPLARTIQIEFVGAPAHYCFEAYEVRLKDETGLDLLHSSIIPVEAMRSEVIDDNTILFGEYNFTDLEVERDYVPSVIPIERANDGRCLCPVSGNNPFDNRVICSCIAADWKKVRLHRLERPTPPPMIPELNGTLVETIPRKDTDAFWTVVVLSVLISSLLLLSLIVYALYVFFRRYRTRGKTVRIRFVSDRTRSSDALALSSVSHTPLIHILRPNILMVYSHDCSAHEAAVIALAEYLRDVFNFEVHVDVWDSEEIERNLMDYVSASIISADRVLVVNSVGAHYRYQNKIQHEMRVERKQRTLHDTLFESQIDQALMHPCVVSVRFTYTPYSMVLPPLSFSLQYILPDNLAPLLSNLTDTNMKSDPRLFNYNEAQVRLSSAVSQMATLMASDPNWFEHSHHRVPRLFSMLAEPTPLTIANGDVHLSRGNESVHNSTATKKVIAESEQRNELPQAEPVKQQAVEVAASGSAVQPSIETRHEEIAAVPSTAQLAMAATSCFPTEEVSSEKRCNVIAEEIEMRPSKGTRHRYLVSANGTVDLEPQTKLPLLDNSSQVIKNVAPNEEVIPNDKQNGQLNGLMGRFVKGFISHSDSGLIADMDSIDVSS